MENESSRIDPILEIAWLRFSELDATLAARAKANQKLRLWIAVAGVLATIFAILSKSFTTNSGVIGLSTKVLPVLIPVIGAGLAAFSQLFYSSGEWKITRSAAEEIQKEIYYYRTILQESTDRRYYLEKRLMEIMRQVYRSMGGQLTLTSYAGALPPNYDPNDPTNDPGFSNLTGDEYFKYRLQQQLTRHKKEIKKYQDQRFRFQILIVGACVIISLLLVMGGVFSLGVELLASLAAALLSWQGLQSIDPIIRDHSKIVLELTMLCDHWQVLQPEERTTAEFYKMVRGCEAVLWFQYIEYIKSMQEPLRDSDLENEAALVNRVIKESVESAERSTEAMRESLVESITQTFQEDEQKFEQTFQTTVGSLAEDASSELVQKELVAMSQAVVEIDEKQMERASGFNSSLSEIGQEFSHIEINKDTPKEQLNAILARFPKTGEVKG